MIGPQMKKPADISVDAGTSHSNTKKQKAILEHDTGYFTSSIPRLYMKQLMASRLDMSQKRDLQKGGPKRN